MLGRTFSLALDVALEGTPTRYSKVRTTAEGEGREILEWALGFRRYSYFCQNFQEDVGESLDRSLSPSPPLTENLFVLYTNPPPPPHHSPLSLFYPASCFVYKISSGPLWPSVYYSKS